MKDDENANTPPPDTSSDDAEIQFTCQHCEASLSVDKNQIGSITECPGCSNRLVIPPYGVVSGMNVGDFVLERRLGIGGMGEVWLADQEAMQRKVALKILSPEFTSDPDLVSRFMREAKIAGKLIHQNIVTAYHAGHDKKLYYLAMTYIEGSNLDDIDLSTIDEEQALKIVYHIANALRYAWNNFNILHRDIKPANIMLDTKGNAMLMDMGISKSTKDDQSMTMTGVFLGTPSYISPEQAQGAKNIDFRADLYSLGATLYHLLTKELPFDAASSMGVVAKHITEDLPDCQTINPNISNGCKNLINKMMAKSPSDRYASWDEFIIDLEEAQAGKDKTGLPVNKLMIIGGAAAAIVICVIALMLIFSGSDKIEKASHEKVVKAEDKSEVVKERKEDLKKPDTEKSSEEADEKDTESEKETDETTDSSKEEKEEKEDVQQAAKKAVDDGDKVKAIASSSILAEKAQKKLLNDLSSLLLKGKYKTALSEYKNSAVKDQLAEVAPILNELATAYKTLEEEVKKDIGRTISFDYKDQEISGQLKDVQKGLMYVSIQNGPVSSTRKFSLKRLPATKKYGYLAKSLDVSSVAILQIRNAIRGNQYDDIYRYVKKSGPFKEAIQSQIDTQMAAREEQEAAEALRSIFDKAGVSRRLSRNSVEKGIKSFNTSSMSKRKKIYYALRAFKKKYAKTDILQEYAGPISDLEAALKRAPESKASSSDLLLADLKKHVHAPDSQLKKLLPILKSFKKEAKSLAKKSKQDTWALGRLMRKTMLKANNYLDFENRRQFHDYLVREAESYGLQLPRPPQHGPSQGGEKGGGRRSGFRQDGPPSRRH